MNKIQVLIDNGFITDNDIQEYICSNQEHNEQEELNDDWFDFQSETRSPKYIIASTSSMMEETMVFPADEYGEIINFSDLACIALRYGHIDWRNADEAVSTLNTDEYTYEHVKRISTPNLNVHNLYKKVYKTND